MLWSSLSPLAGQPAAVRLTPPVSNLNPLLKWAPVTQSPYSAASLSWSHVSSRPLSMCESSTLLWEILDSLGDTHMPWKPEVLAQAHLPRHLLRTLPMNHSWLLYILNSDCLTSLKGLQFPQAMPWETISPLAPGFPKSLWPSLLFAYFPKISLWGGKNYSL